MLLRLNLITLIILNLFLIANSYKIPSVKFEILSKGFRVSIPDETGVKYVAFNVNRNQHFKGFEPGELSVRITEPQNERWAYEYTKINLEKDDVIYIWTNVQHNQLIYRNIEEPISVSRLIENEKNDEDQNNDRIDSVTNMKPADDDNGEHKCDYTDTQVHNRHPCKGELLFEETFDGDHLNSSRWQHEIRVALDVGDAEFVLYDDDNENLRVANGILTITPTLWNNDQPGTDVKQGTLDLGLRCTSRQNLPQECRRHPGGLAYDILPPIKSARINTRGSFRFRFGRIDIRAKLPQGDWLFPLMLLEPTINAFGPVVHELAQLRVAFVRGNEDLKDSDGEPIDGRILYAGTVLYSESSPTRQQFFTSVRRNVLLAEDFHVYTLIWTNNKLRLLIDEEEYGSIDKNVLRNASYLEKLNQEFYITLGLGAGGHGDFPDDSRSRNRRKPWINTSPKAAFDFWRDRDNWKTSWKKPDLQIDFVRVYAL